MQKCIACGMPMVKPEQFAMGDVSKDYCVHCMKPDGTMQSYDEKLGSMKGFIMKTQGFDEKSALSAAREMMKELPAWKNIVIL